MAMNYLLLTPIPLHNQQRSHWRWKRTQHVRIMLYDVLGREVRLINNTSLEAGQRYNFTVGAGKLAGGVYFIMVIADQFQVTRSIVLVH